MGVCKSVLAAALNDLRGYAELLNHNYSYSRMVKTEHDNVKSQLES